MKIISDFDDVLFDNKRLKEVIFGAIVAHKENSKEISRDEVQNTYDKIRNTKEPFSLKKFLAHFITDESEAARVYAEIIGSCKNLVNRELLELVMSNGENNLYVLTTGEEGYQRDKILNSIGMLPNLIIVPESKRVLLEELSRVFKDDSIIFVDDKKDVIEEAKGLNLPNLVTVHYDENGLEMLRNEMKNVEAKEKSRELTGNTAPPMR